MRQFLLDTNILSDLIKHPHGVLAQRIASLKRGDFCTSLVVACELRYGVKKKGSVKLAAKVEALLNEVDVLGLDDEAITKHYASLRVFLEKQGQVIGSNDMLIAAHALRLDVTLITANEKEFKRVPNLRVENWLAD
jgi:tRNA(fMet)-specific endonuclease VapC